jgi:hypothetical protein
MILPILAALAGVILCLLGIWRIHHLKESKRVEHGDTFSICPRYRAQRWAPILLVVMGALCTWGAGASTISAVDSSQATVLINNSEYLVIEYRIKKFRECGLDRLWVETDVGEGAEDIAVFDYRRILKRSLGPDTVVVALAKKEGSNIKAVHAFVKYDCVMGFVVESQLQSVNLPG